MSLSLLMPTGLSQGYGGVSYQYTNGSDVPLICVHLVIFQRPRPGPRLPKGKHYLTLGWIQVCCAYSCSCKVLHQLLTTGLPNA